MQDEITLKEDDFEAITKDVDDSMVLQFKDVKITVQKAVTAALGLAICREELTHVINTEEGFEVWVYTNKNMPGRKTRTQ